MRQDLETKGLLTSYELNNENIANTIITDNAAGILMQREIDICIVGVIG